MVELGGGREVHQGFEVAFRLARESHDHGGPERHTRYGAADFFEQPQEIVAARSTAHVPQYPRARVLKGNVKILAHSGRFGHRRDERVTDLIGITVEEAEPNQAVDLPQFSQEQG